MKILAICPRAPFPPDRGDRIRSYQFLTRLGRNHEIHLACPDTGTLDEERLGALAALGRRVFVHRTPNFQRLLNSGRSLLAHQPLSLGWFHDPFVNATVKGWCADTHFDVALVAYAKMAPYWLRENRRQGLPAVLDLVDAVSEDFGERAAYSRPPHRWIFQRERRLLSAYEREIVTRAQKAVVVSEAEARLLRPHVDVPVDVVENGVDGGSFARPEVTGSPRPRRVVFVGRLDVQANVDAVRWFVNHVHPRVRAYCEDVLFEAVGAHPVRDLRAMRARPDIRVTGWVQDVRPYLWRASVAVAPLRIPSGTTNGVLEAMAASVPVVATPAAARGLARGRGEHVVIAESAEEIAAAVCGLLADPDRAAVQVEAALEYVREYHSWDRAVAKLEEHLVNAARSGR